ncbi:hypothetical protein Clacol_009169 [Clathrus columnatus]|uniref:HMG box domain-containing protein n=1 Tax=Clathrus columnatus TaxID=1419009 RepID=A0AAV5AP12_9AGAM|nr:hypothetical protein Clacol_009169 [Clathrus columnatus]
MPPTRTTKSVSPPGFDSLYPNLASASPVTTIPHTQLYETPSPPSQQTQKKKRSHGKARPPGHIPRPPNAFIIFRTDQIKAMETQNSTPEVSKSLGQIWHQMTDKERQPYIERAKLAKIEHQLRHPDYKYKPIHPRDEFGNCIRKPRNPNKPRVKPSSKEDGPEVIDEEQLGESFRWFENETTLGGFPNPLPPSTPSLPPSTPAPVQTNLMPYSIPRRPSSVPLPMPNNTSWSDFSQPTYFNGQVGYYPSRRLSKRPSTSMDFINMPAPHVVQEPYALSNALGDQFLHQDHQQQHAVQWRMGLGHRRSLSAPNFGELELAATQFSHYPTLSNYTTEANSLTPINPIFNNVFSNFTWSTDNQSSGSSSGQQPSSNIQIPKVPPMSNIVTSSNQITTQMSAPGATQPGDHLIHHPAPVATFDNSSFQDHVKQLETAATSYRFEELVDEASRAQNVGFDNMLGLPVPGIFDTWQQQQPMGYANPQNNTQVVQQNAPSSRTLDFNELIVEGY